MTLLRRAPYADGMHASPATWLSRLRRHALVTGLALLVAGLGVLDPRPWRDWLHWLDPQVLASLLALLAVAQGVRESGWVQRLARRMLGHVHSQRALVLWLLALAALAAMLLTNDVSLFLVLPLTLALCEQVALPRLRVVTLVALAVNMGSTLSPVGNPQNLLLWRHAGVGMGRFVLAMAPAAGLMAACLLAFARWLVPGRALQRVDAPPTRVPLDRRLARVSLLALPVLLVLLQLGQAYLALGAAVLLFAVLRRGVLARLDWGLMLVIALMLVGLGHLADLPLAHRVVARLALGDAHAGLLAGVLLSQAISNVPATVALLHHVPDRLWLAVAVNIGGSGLAIGSLANLIALRLEGSRAVWGTFHRISVPYLLVMFALAWWLLAPWA